MLSTIGRAAIKRLGARPAATSANRLVQSFWSTSRVDTSNDFVSALSYAQYMKSQTRSYAAAATGTTKKSQTKSSTGTKKSGAKKAKKTTKAKKPAKELTEEQKERLQAKKEKEEIKKLKETALLSQPKPIVDSTWGLVLQESMKANATKGAKVNGAPSKEASEKYKSLSSYELEVGYILAIIS